MVEKKLAEVLADCQYIPETLQFCTQRMKCSTGMSISACWELLCETLHKTDYKSFWTDYGCTDDEQISEILSLLAPAVMTSVVYLGLDYLYDSQPKDAIDYYEKYGYQYIQSVFKSSLLEDKSLNDYLADTYNKTKNRIETLTKSAFSVIDPFNVNPYLVYRQSEILNQKNETNFKEPFGNFFPEITFFLRNAIKLPQEFLDTPISAEFNASSYYNPKISSKDLEIHTLLKTVFYLLVQIQKYLPGHHEQRHGHWTMDALVKMDKQLKEQIDNWVCATVSYNPFLNKYGDQLPKLLTNFGVEDLLHLNRISLAFEKFLQYVETHPNREEECYQKAAMLTSLIVYAPTVEVGEYIFDCLFSEDNLMDTAKFLYAANINSTLFPSMVSLFVKLIFTDGICINEELIKSRIESFCADSDAIYGAEIAFFNRKKVWIDEKHFYIQDKYPGKKSRVENEPQKIYLFSNKYSCRLQPQELLTIFTKQAVNRRNNQTIVLYNKMRILSRQFLYKTLGFEAKMSDESI